MKKLRSNSGYTLAPVMVIMVLVLALTGGAIANSVLNLQAQENAVKQMQGKYTAAGEIEKVYTDLKGLINSSGKEIQTSSPELNQSDFESIVSSSNILLSELTTIDDNNKLLTVSVSRQSGSATATAEFEVSYTDTPKKSGAGWEHTITITSVTYKSFDVSYGGTGGGGS